MLLMVSPEASDPQGAQPNRILWQMILIPTRLSAIWSWITNSAIFQGNHLSCTIRYDTQAAYGVINGTLDGVDPSGATGRIQARKDDLDDAERRLNAVSNHNRRVTDRDVCVH